MENSNDDKIDVMYWINLDRWKERKNETENSNKNYLYCVDIIYWINLDRCQERRNDMEQMFKDQIFEGVPIQRFPAFDGKIKVSFELFSDYNGELLHIERACTLSHLECIRKLANSNLDDESVGMICEDDINLEFRKYWKYSVQEILDAAPSDCEILQLCYTLKDINLEKHTSYYYSTHDFGWSTCCYIIKKKHAKKIIDTYFHNNKYHVASCENEVIVSDCFIYANLKSYTFAYPMFIYKSVNDSTIHTYHFDYHEQSKNKVIELYEKHYNEY
jgi:GR25 family glycosyltransferase involved in LPS biosynthesis